LIVNAEFFRGFGRDQRGVVPRQFRYRIG